MGKRSGGLGTTLGLALVSVVLSVALGVGPARFGEALPLVEKARLRAVEKITASARENGILDTAESNAEDSIRAFVTTLGFEEVPSGW